eukprot:CAMPEP_0174301272 /NCGR_PEP_ID=MMETSP0809-20121228/58954_1 /TAXON_ID=73025 ORGANISM="Eutreptiella gymnastica-like, Strain CCMP1594" /NCGR_SAMPLE_ID=MMETSP0809 /ASSEMBLY_ACC=CAM_ASM_000658 /LENGTH=118 /DNA_ID=CAMNT_0015406997 /DNA_START=383 /DNA_END=736 /DNA_ORIENTATION=+
MSTNFRLASACNGSVDATAAGDLLDEASGVDKDSEDDATDLMVVDAAGDGVPFGVLLAFAYDRELCPLAGGDSVVVVEVSALAAQRGRVGGAWTSWLWFRAALIPCEPPIAVMAAKKN